MPPKLTWQAKRDIHAARRRRQTAATRARLNEELRACFLLIQKRPTSFPRHPDAEDQHTRVAQLATLPLLVIFHTGAEEVRVLGVIHARSGPDTLAGVFAR